MNALPALLHQCAAYAIPFAMEFYGIPAEILLGAIAAACSHFARLLSKPRDALLS